MTADRTLILKNTLSGILFLPCLMGTAPVSYSCELVSPPDGSIVPDTRPTDDPFIAHDTDASVPRPTLLQWHGGDTSDSVVFDIHLSENSFLPGSAVMA